MFFDDATVADFLNHHVVLREILRFLLYPFELPDNPILAGILLGIIFGLLPVIILACIGYGLDYIFDRYQRNNEPHYVTLYRFLKKVWAAVYPFLKGSHAAWPLHRLFKATYSLFYRILNPDQQLYEDAIKRLSAQVPTTTEFLIGVVGSTRHIPKHILCTMYDVAHELYDPDFLPQEAIPLPPDGSNRIELLRWRDRLINPEPRDPQIAIKAIASCFNEIKKFLPDTSADVGLMVPLTSFVPDLKRLVQLIYLQFYTKACREQNIFVALRERLSKNTPRDKNDRSILPADYKDDHFAWRDDVAGLYLRNTPLYKLTQLYVPIPITEKLRFEHFHMLASSGAGKTTTIKHFLMRDFEKVVQGQASVIVMESKGTLIDQISHLKAIKDKLVIIDPTDIANPVALSLFSMGLERMGTYSPTARERLQNSLIELLSRVLLPEMTPKQSVLLNAVVRLMLHIPDATIITLYEVLKNGIDQYQDNLQAMSPLLQTFFENEFQKDKQFRETREQVIWRLSGILTNPIFERMFSTPHSKLDLFAEMNAGKVILINTSKDTLQTTGTQLFGNFFIALIVQAAQERSVLPDNQRLPCFVYIDEYADYAFNDDTFITTALRQAREYKVGMLIAHHELNALSSKTQSAIMTNTSIKFVRAAGHDDVSKMAREMETTADFIKAQGTGKFAVFLRNGTMKTALSVNIPIGAMEAAPTLTQEEYEAMRQVNRERYTTQQPPISNSDEAVAAATREGHSDRPPNAPQYQERPQKAAEAVTGTQPPKPVEDAPPKKRKKVLTPATDKKKPRPW